MGAYKQKGKLNTKNDTFKEIEDKANFKSFFFILFDGELFIAALFLDLKMVLIVRIVVINIKMNGIIAELKTCNKSSMISLLSHSGKFV